MGHPRVDEVTQLGAERVFVGNAEKHHTVGSLVPLPYRYCMSEGQLKGGVARLCRLQAFGDIRSGDDVQLLLRIKFALIVVHETGTYAWSFCASSTRPRQGF